MRMLVRALTVMAIAAACADFEAPEDPTFGLPDVLVANPSFSGDIAPILDRRCATGGCHSAGTAQANLQLTPDAAHGETVNVPSVLRPGMDRIEPGDPDNSWLVRMIEADPARRDQHPRMPLASVPLTENQIANIRRWIEQGAQQN
jgi:hypothetical protein